MKLYFQHASGKLSFIRDNVTKDTVVSESLKDLRQRNPKFISYYQRVWTDNNNWTWVDVGSHTEFYILMEG